MPESGEALVRVLKVGVCGTDLHAFAGNQPYFTYPRVPGHELAVEIIDIRDGVGRVRPGQRCTVLPYLACGECVACRRRRPNCCTNIEVLGVHVDGGFQELMALPEGCLMPSDSLDTDALALVENQAVGAHAVARARLEPREYVLVIGAGPIGVGVVQFARIAGAKVIVLDLDAERLGFCAEAFEAEYIVTEGEGAREEIESITEGRFPTAVFDATGNGDSQRRLLDFTAHGGRIVLVGLTHDNLIYAHPEFHKRETTLMSSRNATAQDFRHVMARLEGGWAKVEPLITHRTKLADAAEAFRRWTAPGSGVIKAMVEC